MNEKYLEIYNEQFENTGECQYSEFLGCRHCDICDVEEYQKKVDEILERENHEERNKIMIEALDSVYGEQDYRGDNKCVYNTKSKAFKSVLKIHERNKNWEHYPGISNLKMNVCYSCNRCKIWGK